MRNYYRTLELHRYSEGIFSSPAGYALFKSFQGIIQAPNNSKTYYNGKDGQSIDGLLFCDVGQSFEAKDKVIDPVSGQGYFISGYNSQPLGVTGIKTHHAEHKLVFDGGS